MLAMDAIVTVLGSALFAVIGWAINIHGRVKVHEQQLTDLPKFLGDLLEAKIRPIDERTARIEDALIKKSLGEK